jgi:hypothetical protein
MTHSVGGSTHYDQSGICFGLCSTCQLVVLSHEGFLLCDSYSSQLTSSGNRLEWSVPIKDITGMQSMHRVVEDNTVRSPLHRCGRTANALAFKLLTTKGPECPTRSGLMYECQYMNMYIETDVFSDSLQFNHLSINISRLTTTYLFFKTIKMLFSFVAAISLFFGALMATPLQPHIEIPSILPFTCPENNGVSAC